MNRRSFLGLSSQQAKPHAVPQNALADLSEHTEPLTREDARHLVTRTGFGARLNRVNSIIDMTAAEAIQFTLDEAEEFALPEAPQWYKDRLPGDLDDIYDMQREWMKRMASNNGGFIEKMTLLLHNHLVTGYSVYDTPYYAYTYYRLLRTHALGNFKDLIHKIGLDPAMMIYLDNNSNAPATNEQGQPVGSNENYGRELLELFTMGQFDSNGNSNYTEFDISQIARVLTGWRVDEVRYRTDPKSSLHDSGDKVIFGKAFPGSTDVQEEYDRLIDFIFAERGLQTCQYFVRKLYVYFVSPIPDEAMVQQLAQIMVDNNYEIKPVVQTLLMSKRFFSPGLYGARVKSPIDFLIGFLNETETSPSDEAMEYIRQRLEPEEMNMELFNPPNVAGWPGINPPDSAGARGDHKWLTTQLLPERWNIIADITNGAAGVFDPIEVAQNVSTSPASPFKTALDMAQTFVPIPIELASIREVSEPFAGDPDLPPSQEVLSDPILTNVSKVMLGDMPHYEWPNLLNSDDQERLNGARIVLQNFIALLSRELPEYQLH